MKISRLNFYIYFFLTLNKKQTGALIVLRSIASLILVMAKKYNIFGAFMIVVYFRREIKNRSLDKPQKLQTMNLNSKMPDHYSVFVLDKRSR
ncbi:MAG: hypothetical protein BGN92_14075 [Sphingobacteriales bacterium 41-5]|nr:MAG: hypothetical protein BGN92_14075 [Sphingobacteriales bacterium 41-5]